MSTSDAQTRLSNLGGFASGDTQTRLSNLGGLASGDSSQARLGSLVSTSASGDTQTRLSSLVSTSDAQTRLSNLGSLVSASEPSLQSSFSAAEASSSATVSSPVALLRAHSHVEPSERPSHMPLGERHPHNGIRRQVRIGKILII